MAYYKCLTNTPDCFNCPYPDCVASQFDISRQEAYKRKQFFEKQGREIARYMGYGATQKYTAQRFGVESSRVSVYVKRYREEYLAAKAEAESEGYHKWTREEVASGV